MDCRVRDVLVGGGHVGPDAKATCDPQRLLKLFLGSFKSLLGLFAACEGVMLAVLDA